MWTVLPVLVAVILLTAFGKEAKGVQFGTSKTTAEPVSA
jgi:hypothetical protein